MNTNTNSSGVAGIVGAVLIVMFALLVGQMIFPAAGTAATMPASTTVIAAAAQTAAFPATAAQSYYSNQQPVGTEGLSTMVLPPDTTISGVPCAAGRPLIAANRSGIQCSEGNLTAASYTVTYRTLSNDNSSTLFSLVPMLWIAGLIILPLVGVATVGLIAARGGGLSIGALISLAVALLIGFLLINVITPQIAEARSTLSYGAAVWSGAATMLDFILLLYAVALIIPLVGGAVGRARNL